MALFTRTAKKKETKEKAPKTTKATKATKEVALVSAPAGGTSYAGILRQPRITEKATVQGMNNVYTFNVEVGSSKTEIAKAIFSLYKVKPVRVNVVNVRAKVRRNPRSGKAGMSAKGKKAYVYLKKGDSINIA